MKFEYNIAEDNSVTIFEDGRACVTQPISPVTGEPFADYEEAQVWAEAHVAERQAWYETPFTEE